MAGTNRRDSQWWLLDGGTPIGPYPFAFIAHQLETGALSPEMQAIPAGGTDWRKLRDWEQFPSPQSTVVVPVVIPPVTPAPIPVPTRPTDTTSWLGYLLVPGIVIAIIGFRCIGNALPGGSQQRALARLKAQAVQDLNASKQTIFNQFHPVGRAKSVDVHDVTYSGGSGGEVLVVYRFTLHWESPLITNGFTKLQVSFDPESQAVVNSRILATNGTTNAEAQQMAFDFGRLLGEAARQEQERRRQDEFLRRQRGY
jgi:hypothetical protein